MHAVGLYRNSHLLFYSDCPMLYMIDVKIVSLCNCFLRVDSPAVSSITPSSINSRHNAAKHISFIDLINMFNDKRDKLCLPDAHASHATQCDPTTSKLQYHAQVRSALVAYQVHSSSSPSPFVYSQLCTYVVILDGTQTTAFTILVTIQIPALPISGRTEYALHVRDMSSLLY
jgi:hypothetical protein